LLATDPNGLVLITFNGSGTPTPRDLRLQVR